MLPVLQHLRNVETRLYCPQAFLSLDFQCRDDVSEVKQTFRDYKSLRPSGDLFLPLSKM